MMQTTEIIWHNGQFIPWENAKIHVLSHALHYGGGVFEGIRFYQTDQGPAIFRLSEHVDRLLYSADILKIAIPYSKEDIMMFIRELVRKNRLASGYIRPIAFYGYGKMGVNPVGNPTEFVIACWPWGAYLPAESVDVKVSRYTRIHPDSTHVTAKVCGHYVNSMLASLELQGTHYHEALLLDTEGYVSEGVSENFFLVKNNVIYTPQLGTILAGITRDTIIQLAQQLGFQIIEKNISLQEVYEADEAFFTGTAAEITPIRSVNEYLFATPIGPVTKKIKETYLESVTGKNANRMDFLTYAFEQPNG